MPDIILVVLAVIFVLGVAINIHEFGHFIVAKFFGMRVEAYSFFGLGPRIWGFRIGETDYRISAIPLGAYVKLYGDDATAPLEGGGSAAERVPESELYELRPRWQKFLVMLGGPFMNIVLALAIPFSVGLLYGVPSITEPVVSYVAPGGAAARAGIEPGDRIVAFDGQTNPTWRNIELAAAISPEKPIPVIVERGGNQISLVIVPTKIERKGQAVGDLEMRPDPGIQEVYVGELLPDSPAIRAGLKQGDKLVSVNGKTVRNVSNFKALIQESAKSGPITVTFERGGERRSVEITPTTNESGESLIGAQLQGKSSKVFERAGVAEAAAVAVNTNYEIIALTGRVFGQLFSGQRAVKDAGLAGPVGIVSIIASVVREDGFIGLFSILSVISLNLGIFNLLPIPLLDGGQIMVLGIEKVMSWFGRTLSAAFRERIQLAGLAIILLLMAFTLFMDISRLFR
ncbi:MAG: RIP metalloprotease RseP [Blastocatellia bacterium]